MIRKTYDTLASASFIFNTVGHILLAFKDMMPMLLLSDCGTL